MKKIYIKRYSQPFLFKDIICQADFRENFVCISTTTAWILSLRLHLTHFKWRKHLHLKRPFSLILSHICHVATASPWLLFCFNEKSHLMYNWPYLWTLAFFLRNPANWLLIDENPPMNNWSVHSNLSITVEMPVDWTRQ